MEAFEKLIYLRNGKAKRHYFGEFLCITMPAMICGMDGFDDFERFAKLKETWRKHQPSYSGSIARKVDFLDDMIQVLAQLKNFGVRSSFDRRI